MVTAVQPTQAVASCQNCDQIVDLVPEPMILVSVAGTILAINRAGEQILLATRAELIDIIELSSQPPSPWSSRPAIPMRSSRAE